MLLGSAWVVLFVGVAYRLRPAPVRVRSIVRSHGGAAPYANPPHGPDGVRRPLTERVGTWLLARVRRGGETDPITARRVGAAVLGGCVLLPVFPPAALGGALVGYMLPSLRAARAEKRRLAALAADLPDVVDLLVLAVGAGLTVHLAVAAVGARASGPLAAELRRVVADVALGRRLADALDEVPGRAGEAIRPLTSTLASAERYGAPLVSSLERLAAEVRRDRRRRAEESARKLPVKLLFPLVACTLPAFALLTVAPLIAAAIRSLHI
ncbi:MAG: type II secretion system F family protein [Actinomycetota bacterium]|nr:type II secretion system F family protein [Actinomycetota bacterium]